MRETIKEGARGTAVLLLQGDLNECGAHLVVDGDFGPMTDESVRDFQAYMHLVEDGVVGPKTWQAIEDHLQLKKMQRTRDGIDPCSAAEALQRMEALAKVLDAEYQLGTGDYNPGGFAKKYDCAGAAICEAYKLTRHREGFASGSPPYADMNDVDDDINTNSALEDAFGPNELFELVPDDETVQPGDLVMWATIHVKDEDGKQHTFIGHVLMFKSAPEGWTPAQGWHLAKMLQCCGKNGRRPAVIETDGHSIDRHNQQWPKLAHRAYVVRVKQSV